MHKQVQAWLGQLRCPIRLHFIPSIPSIHLNPIERLSELMHEHITHDRCYERFAISERDADVLLREEVPETGTHINAYQMTSASSRPRISDSGVNKVLFTIG